MSGRRVELMLWVLLAVTSLLHLVTWQDPDHRNLEFLPDMVTAVPYETQSANPHFADGMTMRRPPVGTIARGRLPLRSGDLLLDAATPWDELPAAQQRAWNGLEDPGVPAADAEPDPAAKEARLRRGEQLFVTFCAPCHGAGGGGDGIVTQRGVPPPPSLLAEGARALSDGRLYRIITSGRGNMPGYATQIEREDRWTALRYLRALQSR